MSLLYYPTNLVTKRLKLIVNFSSTDRPKLVDGARPFEFFFKESSIVNFTPCHKFYKFWCEGLTISDSVSNKLNLYDYSTKQLPNWLAIT